MTRYRINLLPWITTKEPFRVLGVVFSPATEAHLKELGAANIWPTTHELANCFHISNVKGKQPSSVIAIHQASSADNGDDSEAVRNALEVLAYSHLSTFSFEQLCYDNFQLWPLDAPTPSGPGVAIQYRIQGMTAYTRLDLFNVYAPPYVRRLYVTDSRRLSDLLSLVTASSTENEYVRMIRAMGWYNRGFTSAFNVYEWDRIVWLVTAFETLLNLPKRLKRAAMVSELTLLLGEDERLGKFAKRLYEVRSDIVHGAKIEDPVPMFPDDKKGHIPIWVAGRLVFDACIEALMYLRGAKGYNPFFGNILAEKAKAALLSNRDRLQSIGQCGKFTFEILEKEPERIFSLRTSFEFTNADMEFDEGDLEKAGGAVIDLTRKFVNKIESDVPDDVKTLQEAGWDTKELLEKLAEECPVRSKIEHVMHKYRSPDEAICREVPSGLSFSIAARLLCLDDLIIWTCRLGELWQRREMYRPDV